MLHAIKARSGINHLTRITSITEYHATIAIYQRTICYERAYWHVHVCPTLKRPVHVAGACNR